jgi:hypothetical protein
MPSWMGECSVCHAFGSPQETRAEFAKLAQQALQDADELLPLVPSDQTRERLSEAWWRGWTRWWGQAGMKL